MNMRSQQQQKSYIYDMECEIFLKKIIVQSEVLLPNVDDVIKRKTWGQWTTEKVPCTLALTCSHYIHTN